MIKFIRHLINPEDNAKSQSTTLHELLFEAADRFAEWISDATGDDAAVSADSVAAMDRALEEGITGAGKGAPLPEEMASDAASFLGEAARRRWGGHWVEGPRYGLVLQGCAGIPTAKLMALPLIEKKWQLGSEFSLAGFFQALEKRFEAEKQHPHQLEPYRDEIKPRLAGKTGPEAQSEADALSQEFRAYWKERFKVSLPLSLTGVRELDGYIRSNYYINFLTENQVAQAGFFVGEVTRGLFEGNWNFEGLDQIERAALQYPELSYYPIGRLYKMLTERPEREPLDEYIRLLPSARKELREKESP